MDRRNIPVTRPYFDQTEESAVIDALRSGWVAQGPRVAEFERAIAAHEGVAEGVACTSCTAALHLAYFAQGMSQGMDVITPALTFVATQNAIVQTGATPVLADVREDTFNIDTEEVSRLIQNNYYFSNGRIINKTTGNRLWGIVPVHEFGLCCDIDKINELAHEYGLQVIEDSACALGSAIGNIHQGGFGNTSCVSFHPRKSITTGEGGMVLTNDPLLAKRMRELRSHGSTISADDRDKGGGYLLPEFNEAGFNYRMTDLQAAIGLAQAEKLDDIIEKKRKAANYYCELIGDRLQNIIAPHEPEEYFHTFQSFVCMLDIRDLGLGDIEAGGHYRDELCRGLERKGVATRQGTHAVHLLGYYRKRYGYNAEDYPHAYACDKCSIALPLYADMRMDDQQYVIESLRQSMNELL